MENIQFKNFTDSIMNADREYSKFYPHSNTEEEYAYNAMRKNIVMIAENAGCKLDEQFKQNPLQINEFESFFMEDANLSLFLLSLFNFGVMCGENIAKKEILEYNSN